MILYAGFLLFYFVPWNFQQVDEAAELEIFLKQRGNIHSLDELSIGLTGLFAFSFVICSLISVYKIAALVYTSNWNSIYVACYLFTLVVSVMLSLARHEKFQRSMLNSLSFSRTVLDSITICLYIAQIVCSLARGGVLYEILCTSKSSFAIKDTKLKTTYATIIDVNIFLVKFWCFFSVVYGGIYYDEVRV